MKNVTPTGVLSSATWIFGYGSLMWRPGFKHLERRAVVLEGYHRAFCRYSFRHRGTPEQPGLVIGLREGGGCLGYAFRVHPADEPAALAYLDEREGAGYQRLEVTVQPVPGGNPENFPQARPMTAWAYIPDPAHPSYFGQTDRARIVQLVAHGLGESGSAYDYLRELVVQLNGLEVEEPELTAVLEEVTRVRQGQGIKPDTLPMPFPTPEA